MSNYSENKGKFINVNEDGLRTSVYPSGVVLAQIPGQSHTDYAKELDKGFSKMTQSQMSNFAFGQFKVGEG